MSVLWFLHIFGSYTHIFHTVKVINIADTSTVSVTCDQIKWKRLFKIEAFSQLTMMGKECYTFSLIFRRERNYTHKMSYFVQHMAVL